MLICFCPRLTVDKDCKVLDWVTFNSPLALNTSVRHAQGKADADGVSGDEVVYVRPQMVTTGQVRCGMLARVYQKHC